jgi:hypothetical protein
VKWTEHVSVPANPMQASQAAIQASVPQIAEADAALAAADLEHAAGSEPVPRQPARAPQIRPRDRVQLSPESLLSA